MADELHIKLVKKSTKALRELDCPVRAASESNAADKCGTILKTIKDGSPVEVLIRDGKVEFLTAPDDPCFRRRFFDLLYG